MMALLSPAVLRAVAVAAFLAAAAWAYSAWADHQRGIGRDQGRAEVLADWTADKLARAEQNRLLLMARDKATTNLQASADKERQALNEKNRSIGRDLADALGKLRDRPERPKPADSGSVMPENAGPAGTGPGNAGCTGSGLFKDDSEFLTRAFADADRLRLALQSCRATYRRAQETVNGG